MQKDTLINRFLEGTLSGADDLQLEARLEALTLVSSADMAEFRTKLACFRRLYMPGDNYNPKVGKNVARLRKEKGRSQEQLAFECGLRRTYISGVERGVRNPTVLILDKIAQALELSVVLLVEP